MSDPVASSASSATATEPEQITLQILSPSVNVPHPIILTVPVTTNVRQLKEKLRHSITTNPPNDAQRLIHRGRLLARDDETMLELFGGSTQPATDRQTLHLVLRDLSEVQTQTQTPTPPPGSSQHQHPSSRSHTPGHQFSQLPQHQPHPHHPQNPQFPFPLPQFPQPNQFNQVQHPQPNQQLYGQAFASLGQYPNTAFGIPQGAVNGTQLPPGWTQQAVSQNQAQGLARLALAQQNQTQNQNQYTGTYSFGYPGMQNRGGPGANTPGRAASPYQPDSTRTVIREGIGPDGQRWRVTVNESVTSVPPRPGRTGSPLSSAQAQTSTIPQPRSVPSAGSMGGHDLSNIFRPADSGTATRAIADAMRRNASSSSLTNLASFQGQQPIPPGVTTPLLSSRTGSGAGTPDPLRANERPTNPIGGIHGVHGIHGNPAPSVPEVYILTSQDGSRAVLLDGSPGAFSNFQSRGFNIPPPPPPPFVGFGSASHRPFANIPQIMPRSSIATGIAPTPRLNNAPNGPPPQLQPQHEIQVPGPIQAHIGHRMDNPQIQAIGIAQIWPHIWMMIRLALFIWWFTSPTSSWSRWITVVSIAITLFIVNTGALNPIADQIWVPLRRHLENLIPLAADAPRQRPAAGNAQGGDGDVANPARPRDPDPANAAARLVQQRRQNNANWLLNQARRLERAGILFIASLAPGLAERHIAQLEAEARAEAQRQQEAEAAQAARETASGDPTATSPDAHETPTNDDGPANESGPSTSAPRQNADTVN
ncbi:hypothetical protein F4777DRAFT_174644 [Nemania sp. FL0916]|nr:hypothetical protein F4777DRAFT_174644 [Nemania sp. FL0916]